MMKTSLFVNKCETVTHTYWNSFCRKVHNATFFHTAYWADVFCSINSNCKPDALLLTFSDGQQLLLPTIIEYRILSLFKRRISMAAGTFGGFLAEPDIGTIYLKIGMNYLFKHGDWTIRENPFDTRMQEIEFNDSAEDFTQCINIGQGYDHFINNTDTCHRKSLRKASKAQLKACIAVEWNEWQEYYSIYEESIKRWKNRGLNSRNYYSIDLFKKIYNLEDPVRKLWLVKNGNEIASGIICFYWNEHAVAWHGAGSEKYFNDRPNNLLYDTAIHDACSNGFTWFDCNPSGGYKGVIQFKKHLGAQNMRSRIIEKKSILPMIIRKLKRAWSN